MASQSTAKTAIITAHTTKVAYMHTVYTFSHSNVQSMWHKQMHAHVCVYVHTYTHMYTHTCTHIHTRTHTHTYMYTHTSTHTHSTHTHSTHTHVHIQAAHTHYAHTLCTHTHTIQNSNFEPKPRQKSTLPMPDPSIKSNQTNESFVPLSSSPVHAIIMQCCTLSHMHIT